MTTPTTPVSVTIAVTVGGETKVFTADATTEGDPYYIAGGILNGLDEEAGMWLRKTGNTARRGY